MPYDFLIERIFNDIFKKRCGPEGYFYKVVKREKYTIFSRVVVHKEGTNE